MIYAGFWRRLGAFWLDFIIILPISALCLWGAEQSKYFSSYYFLPGLLFGLWFHVYLVKRYGGTPGKLLLKLKITKLDGNPIGYQGAFLRYSVMFVLGSFVSIASILATISIPDETYYSLQFMERSRHLMTYMPSWYKPLNILLNIWIWSEFIVLLTNKKRRAIHDFMASSVVLLNKQVQPVVENTNDS